MTKEIIHTSQAPAAVGPYSQAVMVNGGTTVFLSGQIGLDPKTGELVSTSFEAEVKQAFSNMTAVVTQAGATLHNVVKLTLYLTDLNNFSVVNEIMGKVVPQPYPARSTVGVVSLPKGASFEVEAIVVI